MESKRVTMTGSGPTREERREPGGTRLPGAPADASDALSPEAHRLRGYLLVAFAALCWATGGLTAKWLFRDVAVDPAQLSGARALLATLVLGGYLVVRRRDALRVRARELPFLAAFGVFGLALVHFTYFKTISLTSVATAILLEYLAPVLILVFSVAFLGERLNWALPAAVGMSVLGCAMMVGAIGGVGLVVSPAGIGWGLASAVFFAGYTVMGKYASTRFSQWTLLLYGLAAASLFWFAILGPAEVLGVLADPKRFAAVMLIAVIGTVAPFAAYLTALRYIDATKASITATLEPAIAGVAAFVLLGEKLSLWQSLGGAMVLGAILVVQAPGSARPSLPPPT
jgi:drug/metabolite transporter (DMT)-like permease